MLDFIHNYSSVPFLCRSYENAIKETISTIQPQKISFRDLAAVALCSPSGVSGVHTHREKYELSYPALVNHYIQKNPIIATGSSFSDALLKVQMSGQWYYVHPLGYVNLSFSKEMEQKLWNAINYILTYYSIHELANIDYDWCQNRQWWHEMESAPCVEGLPYIPPAWAHYLPDLPEIHTLSEGPCYL